MVTNSREAISPYPHSHHNPSLSPLSPLPNPIIPNNKRPPLTPSLLPQFPQPLSLSLSPLILSPFRALAVKGFLPLTTRKMATMNSSVLTCNYALLGASDPNRKLASIPSMASTAAAHPKLPSIRSQQARAVEPKKASESEGRRVALLGLAAALFSTAAATSSANASVFDEYLEKSKANKELNDQKRLATSGANFARAFTVQFGTCKFPENFTGCQDLAKQKKVPFLSDDLELECKGKDKFKCGSNVFWKW